MNNPIEHVLKTIRNYELLKANDTVLVACSGGPDSVFLLIALARLKNKLRLKKIAVCSLDHGLRGKESAADLRFVSGLANELGLEFYGKTLRSVRQRAGYLSTEESARKARYAFYLQAAKRAGAKTVATGHTLDDQAETVLMRVIKGSSLKGLVGIPTVRNEGSIRIIRPLAELEKREVHMYLDMHALPYRIDRTNREPIYFRNVVRSEILPYLERFNPRLKRALFSLAEHLREDLEFIERAKDGASTLLCVVREGVVTMQLKELAVQPRAIQKELLREALIKAGGDVKKLSFRHWKELEGLLLRKGKGSSVHLPGSIAASKDVKFLTFRQL